MKKGLKTIIVAALSLIMVSTSAFSVFAYDQAAAQEYADRTVFSAPMFTSDCTYYVSNCINHGFGGLTQNDDWYWNHIISYSKSWTVANDLKEYLNNKQGAALLGRWSYNAGYNSNGVYHYSYRIKNSANIAGLGSEIVFYDWNGNGKMSHAAIVVGTNYAYQGNQGEIASFDYSTAKGGFGDLINQHTTARRHQIWNLNYFNADRVTTNIYAYRLKT